MQEQGGRVTNALAWCLATPPGWWPEVANDGPARDLAGADHRGEREECYAITEEFAGSDVSDLAGDGCAATATTTSSTA